MNKRFRRRFLPAGPAAAGLMLLLPFVLYAPEFVGGPSVRVNPNNSVEFKWRTDVSWYGAVTVFTNADGSGQVAARRSEDVGGIPLKSTDHVVTIPVLTPLTADTGYFFRITATDPTNSDPPFSTPVPLPPFFTGAQAIGDVFVDPDFDRAVLSWPANVIGFGRVEYGISSLDNSVQDTLNVTDHSIELTGLAPGTTYQFRVSNVHAIDQDRLAEKTGLFTTQGANSDTKLREGLARPREIRPGQQSTLSVLVAMNGNWPVSGAPVRFEVLPDGPGNKGSATINGGASADVFTDSSGKATVMLTGVAQGLVRVRASSPGAVNSLDITVVVLP